MRLDTRTIANIGFNDGRCKAACDAAMASATGSDHLFAGMVNQFPKLALSVILTRGTVSDFLGVFHIREPPVYPKKQHDE